MFVILGANGHIGSEAARALLDAGEAVTTVLHSADQEADWKARGANTAVVDVHDVDALRAVLKTGTRAFLLNPPAPVSTDTDAEEQATVDAIVAAVDGSGLKKLVAASTYGAQPGERCGDLSVLYDFEQKLLAQPIPVTIQRAAYYFSNWDALLAPAREGTLATMFPADMSIPMVAPKDLGRAAAQRLREPPADGNIRYVEGPDRYTPQDVADAFAAALGRPVEVQTIPRGKWIESYREQGFSEAAAQSYAKMTAVSVDGGFAVPEAYERGSISLTDYIAELVAGSKEAS